MKVYVMTVIVVGIMILFSLAGIPTTSNKVLTYFANTNTSSIISPVSISSGNNSSVFVPNNSSSSQGTVYWIVGIAIFAIMAVTNQITIGGFSLRGSIESVIAGFIGVIYVFFVIDLLSILNLIASYYGDSPLGWAYWVSFAVIIPVIAGYTISVIEFIRGND